jgi:hypothetical protein
MRLAVGDQRGIDHVIETVADAETVEHRERVLADRGQTDFQAGRAHRGQRLDRARQQVGLAHGRDQFDVLLVFALGQRQLLVPSNRFSKNQPGSGSGIPCGPRPLNFR